MRERISYKELETRFIESAEDISIFGLTYNEAEVLKEVDPIAYRSAILDYYESIRDETWCEGLE